MKPYRRLIAYLLTLVAMAMTADARDTSDDVRSQVRDFYSWYVHTLNSNPAEEPQKSPFAHRYVSKRLLKEIARRSKAGDGQEGDPFLCAQDWDPDWEKNILVRTVKSAGPERTAQVELTGQQITFHRLNLTLVRQGGVWKIDQVLNGDTPQG